ncbi:uncharacterized protein LOC124310506 [Neodiprion virginianus]|uniref:uncharacterized protein LOC124310506 n=1 Tax=Neodiprion virginianus TaxID=2961670 RepID=UPI001EE70C07|nr:uncharacterized protein LOC124310506 [Neodiprion virginianus]
MTTSEPKLAEADGTHLNSCGPKDTLCQLCGLPQIGSNQVRPNGLRGCKCNELSPHYKVPDPPRSVQPSILHPDSLKANLDAYVIESCQPQLSKINSSGTPSSLKMDMCSQKETVPKEVTFEPPQGMDADSGDGKHF